MSKGKDLAATGNKGHLRHRNYASYKLAFTIVTKSRFATPGCPGLRWCWQNIWNWWMTDWYDSLAICFVLYMYLYQNCISFCWRQNKGTDGIQLPFNCSPLDQAFSQCTNALLSPPIFFYQLVSMHFFFWENSEEPHGLSWPTVLVFC